MVKVRTLCSRDTDMRNHLITGGNQDGNVNNRTRHGVVDDDEYDGVHNKQNELEKYKKEL